MKQFAGSESMTKGQISKAHTAGQFGELIRKKHGMSASGAGTSAWDIPCPKCAKSIGLACSLFLPYFFLVQWASGLHADLASMEKFMNLSLPHPSQSRIAWSLVVRHLSRKKGSIPISVQVPCFKESSEVEKSWTVYLKWDRCKERDKSQDAPVPSITCDLSLSLSNLGLAGIMVSKPVLPFLIVSFSAHAGLDLRVRHLKVSLFKRLCPDLCPWILPFKVWGITFLFFLFSFYPAHKKTLFQHPLDAPWVKWNITNHDPPNSGGSSFSFKTAQVAASRRRAKGHLRIVPLFIFFPWTSN